MRMPLPKARVGDVVVGDIHPAKGFVMFEVDRAEYIDGHWYYFDMDEKYKLNEMWLEKVYKDKRIGR